MKELRDEFVTYDLALRMKALGFDEPCFRYIYTGDTGTNTDRECEVLPSKAEDFNKDSLCISTPTWQSAFEWFRKEYGLSGWVNESFSGNSRQV